MELSILIPARNEMFLARTIEDVLEHSEGELEIITVLDGEPAKTPLPDDPRVKVIELTESIGQRAATNLAAREACGKYVMKLDAHCAFDQGFDVKMMQDMQPDWTMVPAMRNLHAFDWVCEECGNRRYQGRSSESGCPKCGEPEVQDVLWHAKPNPYSTSMRFDRNLKFQYWRGYKDHQHGDLVDTMSLLGACWMVERDRYFDLNMCDEKHGSWGQQGTEVACKTWLSGGRLVCTLKTWFAHMFRTQGGDFGFPYPLSGKEVGHARSYSKEMWRADAPEEMPKWDKAIHPLAWLVEKFKPVPDWHDMSTKKELTKGIVYYTDGRLDPAIRDACQAQLKKIGLPVVAVTLDPDALNGFGDTAICMAGERGPRMMFLQILAGLEALDADIAFLCEHDVIYHPSHFEFVPPRTDRFYYNNQVWRVDAETGRALFHYSNHTSQLCAYRQLLLKHYHKRVQMVEESGFSRRMGYEPGTHGRPERVDDYKCGTWMSESPNLDIRHRHNLTQTRWSKDQFVNQRYTKGWTIAEEVPGWGITGGRMKELFNGLSK